MILGIDASNIRAGGGLTHLKAILENGNPINQGFTKVIVWSNNQTLQQLPTVDWLEKQSHPHLNKSSIWCFFFQIFYLKTIAAQNKCSVIFAPGGTFVSTFSPFVTMSQNMLPFEYQESKHYNFAMRVRLFILFFTQSFSFKRASGMIFLTQYAQNFISQKIKIQSNKTIKIPHGVSAQFQLAPRIQCPASDFNSHHLFEFLYVSYVTIYKHHWNIAQAVCELHQEGYPIKVTLIGSTLDSFEKVQNVLNNFSNASECVTYIPGLPHQQLIQHYHQANAFVFGSSCENMPIILIEAMSAGLPIISSNAGPMPEVLGDAGLYFNPRQVSEIKEAMVQIFENQNLRIQLSQKSFAKTLDYTWQNCANNTFQFLYQVAQKNETKIE